MSEIIFSDLYFPKDVLLENLENFTDDTERFKTQTLGNEVNEEITLSEKELSIVARSTSEKSTDISENDIECDRTEELYKEFEENFKEFIYDENSV